MTKAFITSFGSFLPGSPVTNDQMESFLRRIHGSPSRLRERVLKQNGIKTRHYAIDENGKSVVSNAYMAGRAIEAAISGSNLTPENISLLVAATTQADYPVPGFASMVHAETALGPCEISSHTGVCASGIMALRNAASFVRAGEGSHAVVAASEFSSRLFKASRYESLLEQDQTLPYEAEFLRWMLSDGAGAAIVSSSPGNCSLALEIEWIDIKSYACQVETCMYVGTKDAKGNIISWLDYPDFETAVKDGALTLRQDVRMLKDVVKYSVDGLFRIIEERGVVPRELDWIASHYSSEMLKGEALELIEKGGISLPHNRWFSNLSSKGNTGAASIFILLEELLQSGQLAEGQRILAFVPESGRFTFCYMLLKVVSGSGDKSLKSSNAREDDVSAPKLEIGVGPLREKLVRELTRTWFEFERELNNVPIIERLNAQKFTIDDYKNLLCNLRQQVIEGSRWISRVASNITREHFELRSAFIHHSKEEHRDFEMIERDFCAVGGELSEIQNGKPNIGTQALSGWILHQASQENPFHLLGTMFIIEGLGQRVIHSWGRKMQESLQLRADQIQFFSYHSESDIMHFERLNFVLDSGILTEQMVENTLDAARVTARLYRLQLEEI